MTQAAQVLGCSLDTIRRYEGEGLVQLQRAGNVRIVSRENSVTIAAAREFKKVGRPRKVQLLKKPNA